MDDLEYRRQCRMAMRGWPQRLELPFGSSNVEMRAKPNGTAAGSNFHFTGYATVYDYDFPMWDPLGEPYTEYVAPGAFRRSLANPNLDVPFLIGHDSAGICLARTKSGTMSLADDSRGVLVDVPSMDGSRYDVQALASAVDRDDQNEMSMAFVCNQQRWSDGFERRGIIEGDLHRGDVCSVVHGANDGTAGAWMGPVEQLSFRRPVAIGGPVLLERRAAMSLAGQHGHPGLPCIDPDGDGDCDQSPAGDTDHDYWTADGKQIKPLPDQRAASGPYELRADMSTADINDLADSDFAYIEPGGEKDSGGKTTPRSKRHFPIHDAAHVRNALARAADSPFGDKAMPAIKAAAKKFGIDVSDQHAAGMPLEQLASAAESLDLSAASDYNPYTAPSGLTCPQCGAGNHGGSKFCSQCGHSFAAGTSAGTSANVMVDDSTGIPGEETQFSEAQRRELRVRMLELEELAAIRYPAA